MQRDFKVVGKGLKGPHHDVPFVTLVSEYGEKLTIHVDRKKLNDYYIEQIFTVIVEQEQQTLDEENQKTIG